jgi:proteasome accessory factor C
MPLEKGKLVRQLSLVSYLMSMNRPVTARDVRECVEGYAEMGDDAFARRFYADRTELLSLGIPLQSNRDDDTGEELYTLSEKAYFLPELDLQDHEVAALHSCLSLLDGQFAYAEPLRLALQNLMLGRANPATDAALASTTIRLVGSDYSPEIASRIAKLETAISKRRTVTFNYYTMGRDEESERVVDPYALIWNGGQWYLVGHSHERDDLRVFRLTRIRGEIKFTSRRERDFEVPEDFDASIYRTRPDWQLGEVEDEPAVLWVHPMAAWWVERSFGHAGEVEHHEDGSITFTTPYAGLKWISSWVCGMNGLVRPIGPAELVDDVRESLERIAEAHDGAAPKLARPVPVVVDEVEVDSAATRRKRQAAPVGAEQFAMLQALLADLLATTGPGAARGAREGVMPVATITERYGLDRKAVQEAVDLLMTVNFGAGAYVMYAEVRGDMIHVEVEPEGEVFRKPARLSPLEAKALMLALDLVGPLVAATASSDVQSVREKLVDAFGGYGAPTVPSTAPNHDDQDVLTKLTQGLRESRVLRVEYYSHSRGELGKRDLEPHALQRMKSHWYLVAWCRQAEDVRSFRLDRVKSVQVLKSTFTRRELELDGYEADTPKTLEDAPRVASVRFEQEIARVVLEQRPDAQLLKDGSVLQQVAAATDQYLVEEVLKARGLATVVTPGDIRRMLAERSRELLVELAQVPVLA